MSGEALTSMSFESRRSGPARAAAGAVAERLLPKVRRIVRAIARRLPGHVDRDDVFGAACLGLAQALSRGASDADPAFEVYVLQRVRGAIADHLRALDVLSRRQRVRVLRLSRLARRLRGELSREPTQGEIAQQANIPEEEFWLLTAAAARTVVPWNEDVHSSSIAAIDPGALLDRRLEQEGFLHGRAKLRRRFQRVLELYYERDLTQREIGKRLGISESRVCQLRKRALVELRSLVEEELQGEVAVS